jgi:hypothetical protein
MYKIRISLTYLQRPDNILFIQTNIIISLHFLTDFNRCAQTHIISQPFPYCLFKLQATLQGSFKAKVIIYKA